MFKLLLKWGVRCCMLVMFFTHFPRNAKAAGSDTSTVTIVKTSISLADLFDVIKKQTGLTVFYNSAVVNDQETVQVNYRKSRLSEVLDELFNKRNISWSIQNSFIILKKKENSGFPTPANQTEKPKQVIQISGSVVDEKKQPLPGVTIKVKNTPYSATTNQAGIYSIAIPDENAVLVFSFVGYQTLEVLVKSQRVINVSLEIEQSKLNEVVVIGYGSVKKGDLTGAVSQVNIIDFDKAPVKSLDAALAGRVAGVSVTSTDGQPGGNNKITVRGSNSLTQDNSPLYVIDGFPIENPDVNQISNSDIESINILKDASATAIYGSRGANGVVIITTKRGKVGEPVISYNGYFGFQQDYNRPQMMNAYDFLTYEVARFGATEVYPRYGISPTGLSLEDYRNIPSIDWQARLFQRAPMYNNDLAIRGGTDKTQFSISLNGLNQEGMIINSGFNRYGIRLNLDQKINTRLKVGVDASYSYTKNYGLLVTSGGASNQTANLLIQGMGYRPISGVTDQTALTESLIDPGLVSLSSNVSLLVNPIISAQNALRDGKANALIFNGYISYQVAPSLVLRLAGGINNLFTKNEYFNNSNTSAGNPVSNPSGVNGGVTNNQTLNWTNENTLTYNKTFNRVHSLNILGGFTLQGTDTYLYGLSATNVPNESLGLDGLDESTSLNIQSQSSRNTLASVLGRVNYTYKSKYLFTATVRRDGSSKFVDQNRWGWFPSGALAWKMVGENFMKKLSFISEAKLRLSYGVTGNNRVSDFPYLSQIGLSPTLGNYSFNNVVSSGTRLVAIGSTDLKWETTSASDIGYDFGVFNNRITLTVDLYRKITKDLLLNANIPYTTGFTTAFRNIGKMQNQGLEITLNTTNISTPTFSWTSNFNISFNQNKILALTENEQSIKQASNWDSALGTPPYIGLVGESLAQFYGLIWDGVYQISDFNTLPDGRYVLKSTVPANGTTRSLIQPGDIKYRDLNGDLLIDAKDYTVLGRALPIHTGGFSNNFSYKGFGLNVLLQWSYGNQIMNANRLMFQGNWKSYQGLNQFASYKDWWTPDNQSSTLFRPSGMGPSVYSNRVLENGSFLRLKTVSLDYKLPSKLISKVNLKSARVYVTAQNLYTLTGYSGRDPDVSSRNFILTPGFDYAAYPQPKTVVFGFNVSF